MPIPRPPSPFPAFNTRVISRGTRLVRVHSPALQGNDANPCCGGPSRFAPIFQPDGSCLPTLYGAANLECAVFESVFHDAPYAAGPKSVRLGKVTSRAISWLRTRVDLKFAMLNEPDLNKLGLTRADLIDTPPSTYPDTARWAEAFHRADSSVSGLAWTSRRCDPQTAYLFFGDRLPRGALRITNHVNLASSADCLSQIRFFGMRAGITLTV